MSFLLRVGKVGAQKLAWEVTKKYKKTLPTSNNNSNNKIKCPLERFFFLEIPQAPLFANILLSLRENLEPFAPPVPYLRESYGTPGVLLHMNW